MTMVLEDYIEKYGEESGTKRYYSKQMTLVKRKETYAKQPYRRLTKEWYMWRYPEDGLERFNEFAGKCAHTEANFIRLHGEVEGKIKHKETIAKKNTVKLVREKYGDDADAIIAERYKKQRATMDAKSDEEKADIEKRRSANMKIYTDLHVKGKKRIDYMIEKHGEEEGTQRYHETMKKAFAGPCRMSAPALKIYKELAKRLEFEVLDRLYCDVEGKKEFWLFDGNDLYSYDFADRETKTILEYNGTFWHPEEPSEDIHPITKETLIEMYEKDQRKTELAKSRGFTVIIITDNMGRDTTNLLINQFISCII